MNPINISFVMPMYNESQAIANTVKGLTHIGNELTRDYEIIITNDGSTDDSGRIIDKIAEKDPRVNRWKMEYELASSYKCQRANGTIKTPSWRTQLVRRCRPL